ncbi:hypothetical protein MMC25_003362 [Agyrium rufum]|nr:hypothetical protein [Agyrium rufum]
MPTPKPQRPISASKVDAQRPSVNETLDVEEEIESEVVVNPRKIATTVNEPALVHKVQGQKSILTLLVSHGRIFAGTQGGDVLVWSLDTFERVTTIHAHRSSILSLFASEDGALLFSSGGDAIVNIWNTTTFHRQYSLYSTYDIGDIFCVVYSTSLQTVYFGAQNTSIQWYDLQAAKETLLPNLRNHPTQRDHRFFDSKDRGGTAHPRSFTISELEAEEGQVLEVGRRDILQYAHNGYVYCMLLVKNLAKNKEGVESLISGGGDGTIKLWALNSEGSAGIQHLQTLETGDYSVLSLALDGSFLYTGMLGGDINVWDLDTCQQIRTLKAHSADVLTLAVGHGMIFSGGANGYARAFDERYDCIRRWEAHKPFVLASAIATHNNRGIYVTGGNDNCVAVWEVGSGVKPEPDQTSNEKLVDSLKDLVSFKTISSKKSFCEDCRRGASYLRRLFKSLGAESELLTVDENLNPLVFARFKATVEDAPRILFYGHYDVVEAADGKTRWDSDPFHLTGSDGYLYGRGVSDNKGPIIACLYAVADLVAEGILPCEVLFLIEGEEECGSRGFEAAVQRNKKMFGKIDWILVANSYWLNDDFPCLTYGLRGMLHVTVQVQSERPDLHSGVDGSRLLDEPAKDLMTILSSLTGRKGHVELPNFYHPIPPISTAESQRYDAISRLLIHHNARKGDSAPSTAELMARWREPSLTIHGFKTSGPGSKNSAIIPSIASAALSMRLVPNQSTAEVERALTSYLQGHFSLLNTTNTLSITINRRAEPWLGDPDNAIFQTLERAVIEAWTPLLFEEREKTNPGVRMVSKPLHIREGGSIPAIRFLEKEFDAPAAHLPCGQASDAAHLDNERLRVLNLYKAREIFRKVFREPPRR